MLALHGSDWVAIFLEGKMGLSYKDGTFYECCTSKIYVAENITFDFITKEITATIPAADDPLGLFDRIGESPPSLRDKHGYPGSILSDCFLWTLSGIASVILSHCFSR